MTMGVFVQVNEGSPVAWKFPIGYIVQESGCWEWVGSFDRKGYGRFSTPGHTVAAHRMIYENSKGPIPDGLHLDHLCRNRACVNPDHLEPVTCRENLMRGVGLTAKNAKKTHCNKGHPLLGYNLIVHPQSGKRSCRECKNRIWREFSYRSGRVCGP